MEQGKDVELCLGPRFVNIDHDTPLLLPPNLRDWVPSDHLSHFILDAVDELDLRQVRVNTRGTGSEQYPPSMLLSLLLYSYATGVFSSRRIEQSTYESVPARLIAGDSHPDHDTLCAFRRNNLTLINESFVRVLEMAAELKVLKVGQITVAIAGTKVMANASKHSAVSYERSGELIQQLELDVKELMEKAEKADSTPLEEGLSIPAEIARRQERKAQLAKARAEIEARAHARDALTKAEYEKKEDPKEPEAEASTTERMRHRMRTQKGREKYRLRQQTVEPVFGIIKSVLGFRRFMLRGLEKAKLEWTLVSTAYNLKRLHRMVGTA